MFSLRTLFIVVGIAALGVAAIVSDVYLLSTAFVVVTLGILCWAFLERQVAFWRGLFIFGTVYLVCACVSAFDAVSDALPSTWFDRAAARSDDQVLDDPFAEPQPRRPFYSVEHVLASELRETKRAVTHSIGALLFGLVGGLLYAWRVKKDGT